MVRCVYSSMEPNLTVLTLGNTLILCLRHVTAVITVKTLSLVTRKYKIPNRCVSLRNCTESWVFNSMEPNLTVLTLRNIFLHLLRHVTAVITVKIHSLVTRKYKMPNRCVSLRNCTVSCTYSSNEPNLSVLTLRNSCVIFDSCQVTVNLSLNVTASSVGQCAVRRCQND